MMQRVNKLWGHEDIIVNNDLYCGKILTVLPNNTASSVHYHKLKKETFYVLEGQLWLEVWNQSDAPESTYAANHGLKRLLLDRGQSITLEALTPHRFWAIGKGCRFIEFSTHDDPTDSYRLTVSGPISAGQREAS